MPIQIFWPKDLLISQSNKPSKNHLPTCLVLGIQTNIKTYVVVTTIFVDEWNKTDIPYLKEEEEEEETEVKLVGHLMVLGSLNGKEEVNQRKLRFHILKTNIIVCENCNIILYKPPDLHHMELYSIEPISLSLFPPPSEKTSTISMSQLINSHDNQSFINQSEINLKRTIDELNQCWITRCELLHRYPYIKKAWSPSKITFRQIPCMIFNHINSILHIKQFIILIISPILTIFCYMMLQIRKFILILIQILNYKMSSQSPNLIEISATAQQLDLRLQQLAHLPVQYFKIAYYSHTSPSSEKSAEYIRLYNTLWLIINDIMIGYSVGSLLIENREVIMNFCTKTIFMNLLYHDLNKLSIWLMNSPGGIKLNNELCAFLSDLFRWILEFWRIVLIQPILTPLFANNLLLFCGICCSVGGLTLGISLLIDFINVITFHIYCFYYSMAKIYNWCLDILLSLFYLFYGRKRNVLRDRVDSMEYELDEILLGILLFTVLFFLLPTIGAFYFSFTLAQLSIMTVVALIEVIMSLLNHWPIFVILLRWKEPTRIPNGIEIQMNSNLKHLEINSTPLTYLNIFASFTRIVKSLPKSYFTFPSDCGNTSQRYGLLIGLPVIMKRNKLYKLLYRNLPKEPVSTDMLLYQFQKYRYYYNSTQSKKPSYVTYP